jgi:hypothetical protein
MLPDRKLELDNAQKDTHSIPHQCDAYAFYLDKAIEERCDEFDYTLEDDGYIIVYRDLEPAATSIFNYKVIAYLQRD